MAVHAISKEQFDASGNLLVNVAAGGGSGGTSSTFGAAFPGTGTAAGAENPSGDMVSLQVDATGKLLIAGSFTSTPVSSSTCSTPAANTIDATAEVVLASNVNRKRLILQNVGTTVIKITFGATPTQTDYHIALPAGGSADDGTSPRYSDDMWLGAVSAISSAAGGVLVVSEFS